MKIIEGKINLDGKEKVAIINSRFNSIITDRLVEGAKDAFIRHGGCDDNLSLFLVPGAFEIPMVLNRLCQSKEFYAVCCLGAVIRGSTPHFDYISAETTKGVANISLKYNIPVTFGVLTVNTMEQGIERAGSKMGNKGFEAMTNLIELINLYKNIKG